MRLGEILLSQLLRFTSDLAGHLSVYDSQSIDVLTKLRKLGHEWVANPEFVERFTISTAGEKDAAAEQREFLSSVYSIYGLGSTMAQRLRLSIRNDAPKQEVLELVGLLANGDHKIILDTAKISLSANSPADYIQLLAPLSQYKEEGVRVYPRLKHSIRGFAGMLDYPGSLEDFFTPIERPSNYKSLYVAALEALTGNNRFSLKSIERLADGIGIDKSGIIKSELDGYYGCFLDYEKIVDLLLAKGIYVSQIGDQKPVRVHKLVKIADMSPPIYAVEKDNSISDIQISDNGEMIVPYKLDKDLEIPLRSRLFTDIVKLLGSGIDVPKLLYEEIKRKCEDESRIHEVFRNHTGFSLDKIMQPFIKPAYNPTNSAWNALS